MLKYKKSAYIYCESNFKEYVMHSDVNIASIDEIEEIRRRIHYYKKIIMSTSCPQKRLYIENTMLLEVDKLSRLINKLFDEEKEYFERGYRQEKSFTIQDLSEYDGTGGKPAYVAVNGVVYDVSSEKTWGGATHFGLTAGKDVSAQFNSCHNAQAVLSKLPRVGVIKA
jgi:predicted heme/steroid binding protein